MVPLETRQKKDKGKMRHNAIIIILYLYVSNYLISLSIGGAVAQSAERATPGEEVLVRSPLWPPAPYWLGRCQNNVTG